MRFVSIAVAVLALFALTGEARQSMQGHPPSELVSLSVSESVAAPTAATWYLKRQWMVPTGAIFWPTRTQSTVTTAGTRTLIGHGLWMGSFNLSTNQLTDGWSVASPRHFGRLFGCVTTVMSATATNVTVTYVDELGNGAQSSVATTFASSSPVGNCFEILLAATTGQMRDVGIRDITAVSDTAAPTGVIELYGMNVLLDAQGVANALEQNSVPFASRIVNPDQLFIMFFQAATTAQQRAASLDGGIH